MPTIKRTDSLREYQRKWAANRRSKMTESEREEERSKNRQRRASRTPEAHEKNRQYNRAYFASLSPEKRKQYSASSVFKTPEQKQNRSRYMRSRNLKLKYGMTTSDWSTLFAAQGESCAICKSPKPGNKLGWSTDHDHLTGKVRGILCRSCNLMLGNAEDNAERMQLAVAYLKRHGGGA